MAQAWPGSAAIQRCDRLVEIPWADIEHRSDSQAGHGAPGLHCDNLRNAAGKYGLTFGPDPATHNHLITCVVAFGRMSAANLNDKIKVTLLGTGTPYPVADRFGSAILVEAGGRRMLFDCGRGAAIRLSESGTNLSDIDRADQDRCKSSSSLTSLT